MTGLLNGIGYGTQFWGQVGTTPGVAALLLNSSPLVVPIFAFLIYKKKLNYKQGVSILVGFMGIILTSGIIEEILSPTSTSTSHLFILSNIIVLGAGVAWGLYILESDAIQSKNDFPAFDLFLASTVSTVIFLGCTAFLSMVFLGAPPTIPEQTILLVIYLAIFCTLTPFVLYLASIQYLGAIETSVMLLIEVVVAFIIGWIILLSPITGLTLIGGTLILIATLQMALNDKSWNPMIYIRRWREKRSTGTRFDPSEITMRVDDDSG